MTKVSATGLPGGSRIREELVDLRRDDVWRLELDEVSDPVENAGREAVTGEALLADARLGGRAPVAGAAEVRPAPMSPLSKRNPPAHGSSVAVAGTQRSLGRLTSSTWGPNWLFRFTPRTGTKRGLLVWRMW